MRYLLDSRIYLLLIAAPFFLLLQIAFQTRLDSHPDEMDHAMAFCYYENAWWPPDLDSDLVDYNIWGWNRVYGGEFVYIVFGKIAVIIRPAIEQVLKIGQKSLIATTTRRCNFLVQSYRLPNVMLYLVTVILLFRTARRHLWSLAIALVLLCIPQVIYLYSYANDDASSLSLSIFLFLFALTRTSAFNFSAEMP